MESGKAADWVALLEKPNDWQTVSQFWALAQKCRNTVDAAYIRKGSLLK